MSENTEIETNDSTDNTNQKVVKPAEDEVIYKSNKEVEALARPAFEDSLVNMMSNRKMIDVQFYSFIIAKCKVIFDANLPTAGINFTGTSYNLFIGRAFIEWTLEERIAVLVHECRHILGGHIFRQGKRDQKLFNVASDVAMNQLINNLPEGALFPSTFDWAENLTAEQYYMLAKDEQKKQEEEKQEMKDKNPDQNGEPEDCDSCGGSGEQDDGNGGQEECEDCKGSGKKGGNGKPVFDENGEPWKPADGKPDLTEGSGEQTIDDHSKWEEMDQTDGDLAKSVTNEMIKDAMSSTKGNLPGDMEQILKLWARKAKISWKKELRGILASKTGYKISTIKRRDRRFPKRRDLRGRKSTKDKHEILVCVDTSGSMSDEEVLDGLVEILEVAKVNKTDIKVIQVDHNIQGVEIFSEKNKTFNRKGYGGTWMGAGVEYIMEEKIKADVVIYISDMEIEDVSQDEVWTKFNKTYKVPVLWLSSRGVIPDWSTRVKKHKVIDLQKA